MYVTYMIILRQDKGNEVKQVKVTSRIVADVAPEVKQKLQEAAKAQGTTVTNLIIQLAEKEYAKVQK